MAKLNFIFCYALLSIAGNKAFATSAESRAFTEVKHEYFSEARVALIIGNAKYKVGKLKNPENDAQVIAESLKKSNFEVDLQLDLNQKDMIRAIRKFGKVIEKGGVGFFYYAGHAMEVEGNNYLIPVDAQIEKEEDVELEAVKVNRVIAEMENARNRVNIVVLDACRNNPFGKSYRSAKAGLATLDAPSGSYIAYATSPGKVAADNPESNNSLYTSILSRYIVEPGIKIEDVFKKVRVEIQNKSDNQQTPWETSSLTGDFYFQLPPKNAIKLNNTPTTPLSMLPGEPKPSFPVSESPPQKENPHKSKAWMWYTGSAVAIGTAATYLLLNTTAKEKSNSNVEVPID